MSENAENVVRGTLPATLKDAEAMLDGAVYAATDLIERLQYAGMVSGNGHHARQKIARMAVEELRSRWVGGPP